jgi:hypothetical protein
MSIQQIADIVEDELAGDDLHGRHQWPVRWKRYYRDFKSSKST